MQRSASQGEGWQEGRRRVREPLDVQGYTYMYIYIYIYIMIMIIMIFLIIIIIIIIIILIIIIKGGLRREEGPSTPLTGALFQYT